MERRYDTVMTLLEGRRLAEKMLVALREEIVSSKKKVRLAVVVVGSDPVVEKFIAQKQKAARAVGIDVRIYPLEETVTTNDLRKRIAKIVHEKKNTGVIIQLPLPPHINKQYILNSVVHKKDVDVLSARALGNWIVGKSPVMPPVAGAVKTLLDEYQISYRDKYIVVMGAGGLVGRPVALWLLQEGVTFGIITKAHPHSERLLKEADIIISGVGKPGLITGALTREGVVVIDAGTSESAGKLVGDVDFDSVAPKTSFITPVPGGIGPLTVAVLLKNLWTLAKTRDTY